jgi:FKBP-type peptidyl-prolyl cis-trans isomerase FkpA
VNRHFCAGMILAKTQHMSKYLPFVFLLCSCILAFPGHPLPEGFTQTQSGVRYKIFGQEAGCQKPVEDDVIWMHLEKIAPDGEKIFTTRMDPFFHNGVEITVKKPQFNGDIIEVFSMMCTGDSAVVMIPVDSVDRDYMISKHYKGKYYTYHIKLVKFLSPEDFAKEMNAARLKTHLDDSITIAEYLDYNQIREFERDENGIIWFFEKHEPMNDRISPGDSISVHYKLKLLGGTLIDDSYDRGEPFNLVVGKGNVIKGWDIGLRYFAKHEKGTLIIPSGFGYGRQGNGVAIPPGAILVFEIEISDVF